MDAAEPSVPKAGSCYGAANAPTVSKIASTDYYWQREKRVQIIRAVQNQETGILHA
jgi:hypothetical protein